MKIFYFKGVAPKKFKEGSVKKLQLLAVFPSVSEIYENVKTILDEMDIEAIEYTVSADIKMCK